MPRDTSVPSSKHEAEELVITSIYTAIYFCIDSYINGNVDISLYICVYVYVRVIYNSILSNAVLKNATNCIIWNYVGFVMKSELIATFDEKRHPVVIHVDDLCNHQLNI